ncbi:DNA polymerase III chi subunit HolC [Candidatus Nitrosoglobus terrae]|uniref:DNA polymerase III chi subunit HolC n=1 Tax=Candidatus Nitrosoglobus terrae TaxID=1630141 RepID=A0A1Q2SMU4_9GAMM|nr:DNA polymerase III subunit chi [Candidatus Nitrosoglobus terrae]BAW80456.1 DNA polymerase III chi subunit HolC [Candidatus Nitrosoglobus terrae]
MIRVDFYLLTGQACEYFACRLTEKAYNLGQKIYIQTEDQRQAQVINDLLWTFRQGSFIPHSLVGTQEIIQPPVLIGYEYKFEIEMNLLINLSSKIPEFCSNFQRVVEIVDQNEHKRQLGREHYRYYRNQGYLLETHQIEPS